ncbi:MAG: hypothetical protein WD534_02420 [Phycisphaeraceae bacterium]
MLEQLTNTLVAAMDLLLGWLLWLPHDLAIVLVAVGSALILMLVRPLVTNQDLLRRCANDKRRLKALAREARRQKDKPALARYRTTKGQLGLLAFRAEGKPLLLAIVPIALVATWCFERIEFHPLEAGETIEVHAWLPLTATDELVHLVPVEAVEAENGWVQRVEAEHDSATPRGHATWRLIAEAAEEPYTLQLRYAGQTLERKLRVGQRRYEPMRVEFPEQNAAMEVSMRQVKLLGLVPGIPAMTLAPWLVAYLVIVIPAYIVCKRVLKVY